MCFHFKQSKSNKEFEVNGIKGEPFNGVYNVFSHRKAGSISKYFFWVHNLSILSYIIIHKTK